VGAEGRRQVAIVIATRNRCEMLLHTLDRLSALGESHRVVVVDNASSDGTASKVQEHFPQTTVISLSRNLGSAARTCGVLEASEPYIAFSDDDSWWAPGSLPRAAEVLGRNPGLGLIAGRVLVGQEEREDPTCRLMRESPLAGSPGRPGTPVLGFLACAAVVRRSAYLEAGGFHPLFGVGGEEGLLALDLAAAGWELVYVPEIVAHHHPPPRSDHSGRRRRQARNALWLAWMRRPPAGAFRETASVLRRGLSDRAVAGGIRDAVAGSGLVISERRPVGRELESRLRQLDQATKERRPSAGG
jgi:GT2 family glycosyltransferase